MVNNIDDVIYINGVRYIRAELPGDESHDAKCKWWKNGRNTWTCSHGRTSIGHPNGWCDQGCCR